MRGRWRRQYKKYVLCAAGLLLVAVFLFPIYWMIVSSLKGSGEIFSASPSLIPRSLYLDNYRALFQNADFFMYLKNSAVISILSMIGAILLSAPLSYALARKSMKGFGAILFILIIIQMVPGNSMALPLYAMFSRWGITNSYLGVVLANITSSLPFVALVLRTSFLGIPRVLEDAARIDGCSAWGTFLRIILPLTRPALVTCAAFGFIFAWGEFIFALVLLPDKAYWPITMGMRTFIGQHGTDWGGLMATATLSSLPVILIFMLTQKHIVGGITAGSVKG
ncbi:MAG: carbohydrate ABC transporter permease [Lachnospiraceae bacterium]|nr:carbohydrate ABC transporter permease [Lachnospiraceae bacterium]MCI9149045.1 carbohydrate ABC transporter permease [Lachnospiraceae bacterium]